MRFAGRASAAIALLVAAALLAAGCGETVVDNAKTEAAIEHNLERSTGRKVSAVECPSGVEVKKGATFECKVSLVGGKREIATLKILNEDADVALTNLQPEKKPEK
jgi:hypothetical protein